MTPFREWRTFRRMFGARKHGCGRALGVLILLGCLPARAVIFYSTADPSYNTNAPSGALTNSGWQFQGSWGLFLGTPIAPHYFITAEHVGGSIGDTFSYQGVDYLTTAVFDDPQTDLRIWRICGAFPAYAPLFSSTNEVGRGLVVFGRGTQRGVEVTTTNLFQVQTNGWQWGLADAVQRWGENEIVQIVDGDAPGETGVGELLAAAFDADGGPNECHLSGGDSAGAVFIEDGGTWKLAGINYAVDGPYNTTTNGPGFAAALFDEGGLYKLAGTNWVLTPDLPVAIPGWFYATRISSRVEWIDSVLSAPLPEDAQPTLLSSASATGQYAAVANAAIDEVSRTVMVAQPGGAQFYQLRSCRSLRIKSIQLQGGNVVLTYE